MPFVLPVLDEFAKFPEALFPCDFCSFVPLPSWKFFSSSYSWSWTFAEVPFGVWVGERRRPTAKSEPDCAERCTAGRVNRSGYKSSHSCRGKY
mmetsp:Transcript_29017/g.56816  ORF Transcript_29017/g.56816 Transcript_29017/m.56816 type:complete len:93 (+) Transcript_29017:287-565(+)